MDRLDLTPTCGRPHCDVRPGAVARRVIDPEDRSALSRSRRPFYPQPEGSGGGGTTKPLPLFAGASRDIRTGPECAAAYWSPPSPRRRPDRIGIGDAADRMSSGFAGGNYARLFGKFAFGTCGTACSSPWWLSHAVNSMAAPASMPVRPGEGGIPTTIIAALIRPHHHHTVWPAEHSGTERSGQPLGRDPACVRPQACSARTC